MSLCLVTGGAGFIGSHTVDILLDAGYNVRILDSLQPRVHPHGIPSWINSRATFIHGDVTNPQILAQSLEGVTHVIHLAAYQDYMLDFSNFVHTNTESAALLFECIVSNRQRYPVEKIVFASSQSVSGEGRYVCPYCTHLTIPTISDQLTYPQTTFSFVRELATTPPSRSLVQLQQGDWEMHCPQCFGILQPILIDESTVSPGTSYAISKYAIELLADRLGRRYDIPTVCLRYTYVQGPRNSFYNAYSGIARRFALRLIHNLPPIIYEDGMQMRDYVNVRDVAHANRLVLENPQANFQIFNVGGGRAVTVLEVANAMIAAFEKQVTPLIPGEFRVGDTRHTISDISQLTALGWQPMIPFEVNIAEYVDWIQGQQTTRDYLDIAERLMREQGIIQQAI